VIRNVAAPEGIPWIGTWGPSVVAEGDSAAVPQSADADDPPFITLAQAQELHNDPNVVFVDARDPEDYEMGSISGAVLLPFEMFDDYWPAVSSRLSPERAIVTYCSGSECELSLYLGRLLIEDYEFSDVSIFYGGAGMWADAGLPMDTLKAPLPGQ